MVQEYYYQFTYSQLVTNTSYHVECWFIARNFHLSKTERRGGGNAVAQWLRCCATNGKVAGSIPDGVIGIFHLHKILPIAL